MSVKSNGSRLSRFIAAALLVAAVCSFASCASIMHYPNFDDSKVTVRGQYDVSMGHVHR